MFDLQINIFLFVMKMREAVLAMPYKAANKIPGHQRSACPSHKTITERKVGERVSKMYSSRWSRI